MIKIWKVQRYDTCHNCNEPRSIECYDEYDEPIRYSILLDKYLKGKDISEIINSRVFTIMKCCKCGKVYCIDWTGDFPRPLTNPMKLDWFLLNYYNNNNIL